MDDINELVIYYKSSSSWSLTTYQLQIVFSNDNSAALWIYRNEDSPECPRPFSDAPEILNSDCTKKIFHDFKSARVSVIPEFGEVWDGSGHLLEIQHGDSRVKYRWVSQLPKEWEALQSIVNRIEGLIRDGNVDEND